MKIWYQYGSEHSANLVMIGQFENIDDATSAKEVIDLIINKVNAFCSSGEIVLGDYSDRYGNEMLDFLIGLNMVTIAPNEIEQFAYECNVKLHDDRIVITTEELDISAFLKVMIQRGARIEVYSAHDYTDTQYGRGM